MELIVFGVGSVFGASCLFWGAVLTSASRLTPWEVSLGHLAPDLGCDVLDGEYVCGFEEGLARGQGDASRDAYLAGKEEGLLEGYREGREERALWAGVCRLGLEN